MSIFQAEAIATTRDLAKQRGVFPLWHESVYAKHGDERRNAFLSSAAPTGSFQSLLIPIFPHMFILFSTAIFFAPSSPCFVME